ncbi:hypothetical protein [Actinoplanes sp. NPDC048796]|uniref:hypothetical protein n=1 Tax=Actinoplanes sp. NPDC048796 TaxID=3155640 RepID=UPI0033FA60C5
MTRGIEIELPSARITMPSEYGPDPGAVVARTNGVTVVTDRSALPNSFIAEIVSDPIKSFSYDSDSGKDPDLVNEAVRQAAAALTGAPRRGRSVPDTFRQSGRWTVNRAFREAYVSSVRLPSFMSVGAQFTQSIDQYASAKFIADVNDRFLTDGPWKEIDRAADHIAKMVGSRFAAESNGRLPNYEKRLLESYLRVAIPHWTASAIQHVNQAQGGSIDYAKKLIPVLMRKDYAAANEALPDNVRNFLMAHGEEIKMEVNRQFFGAGSGMPPGRSLASRGLRNPDRQNDQAIWQMMQDVGIIDSNGQPNIFLESDRNNLTVGDFADNALYGHVGPNKRPIPPAPTAEFLGVHKTFDNSNTRTGEHYYEFRHHDRGISEVDQVLQRSEQINGLAIEAQSAPLMQPQEVLDIDFCIRTINQQISAASQNLHQSLALQRANPAHVVPHTVDTARQNESEALTNMRFAELNASNAEQMVLTSMLSNDPAMQAALRERHVTTQQTHRSTVQTLHDCRYQSRVVGSNQSSAATTPSTSLGSTISQIAGLRSPHGYSGSQPTPYSTSTQRSQRPGPSTYQGHGRGGGAS